MATGFNGLDDAAPNDNAYIGDGASEIRSVKAALIATFPAVTGEITKPSGYGPGAGSQQPTSADYSQLFTDIDSIVSPSASNSPVIPQGTVTMWSGNPGDAAAVTALNDKGWFLCTGGTAPNGYNIPNLQNRFVKGWGDSPVGTVSGGGTIGTLRTSPPYVDGTTTPKSTSASYTLTEANLPQHDHLTVADVNADDELALTSGNAIRKEYTPGGVDAGYFLRGENGAPNIGKTSSYGSASPTPISVGIDVANFSHDHTVEVSGDLEPSHYVIAYIIYAGVV